MLIEKVKEPLITLSTLGAWDDFFNSSLKLSEDFEMERDFSRPTDRMWVNGNKTHAQHPHV